MKRSLLLRRGGISKPYSAPSSGPAQLGLVPNAGFPGSYGAMAASLNPKSIREDHLSQGLVDWAAANNASVLGLGGPLTMTLVNTYPTIDMWEYDNEPYFRSVVVADWAVTARNFGATFKAAYPTKKLILPMITQTNGGDYLTGGVWSPWANQVFDAAPDIGTYFDGWSAHPYNRNGAPDFTTLDKVRGQLVAKNFTKSCWVTELGWSVGTNQYQYSEATQATYVGNAIDQLRTRSWVEWIYWYCLRSWGTDYEGSFGLFNTNGTERQAAAVYRGKV